MLLRPATLLNAIEEALAQVDQVLVTPNLCGQAYLPASTARIASLRRMLEERGLSHVDIEVDGGIKADNAAEVVAAGATVLVVGSGIFNRNGSVAQNIAALRARIGKL